VKVKVKFLDGGDVSVLYCHYLGQTEPQPCFIALDLEDGELWADYDANIGNGVPMAVFHGRTLRYPISHLTANAANDLLDEAAPLAQEIIDGASIEWDGENHVGVLAEGASRAHEDLIELCADRLFEERDVITEMDAGDWWPDGSESAVRELGITVETTDEEIAGMAEKAEEEALYGQPSGGPVMLIGMDRYLTTLRDDLRED
jgi:hypothetical protein